MKKLFLVLVCLFFGTFSWGCRSGVYGDFGSTIVTGSSSVSGTVTATLAGGSIRALAGSVGVAGAYVWIEERPDLNATTDANGNYVINNVPAGTFNVVARFTQGNTKYKTRQKSVIVEENKSKEVPLNVVEAKNVVKGQLLDENGTPLPLGTKLHLWGEEFEIIDGNGNFISPPLPDLALEDLLQEIIVNQGQANQFNMPVSFVSDEEPLEIKVYVPSNPSTVSLLPKIALVAMVNGALVTEVDAGAQVTVRAIVHPADITSENVKWIAPALGTLGEATVVNNNLREKIWTAPAAGGRAEIKVEITSANKTAFAMLPITVKGPQAPVQFVVTFNSNGGSAEAAQTINSGAKAVEPSSAPTKAGFTFGGWYKEEALNTVWIFATDTVTSATTLFAKWTVNPTYTVIYNDNGKTGGSVPTDANTYAQGAQVTVAGNTGNLVKTGNVFYGWNSIANGGGTSFAAGSTFNMAAANVNLYAVWVPITISELPFSMNLTWGNPEAATSEFKVVKSTNANDIDSFAKADAVLGADVILNWTANVTQVEIKGLRSNTTYSFAILAKKGASQFFYPVQTKKTTNILNPSVISLANGDLMFAYKDVASSKGKTIVYGLDGSLKAGPKDFYVNNLPVTDTWDTKFSLARVNNVVYVGFAATDCYYSRVSTDGTWIGTKIISNSYNSTLYGPELAIAGDRLFYYSSGNWSGTNQGSTRAMSKVSDNSTISFPAQVEFGNPTEIRGIAASGIGAGERFIAVDSAEESDLDLYYSIYNNSDGVVKARTKIGNIKSGTISVLKMSNNNALIAYQDGTDSHKGKVIAYDDAGTQIVAPRIFGATQGSWRLPMVNTDAGKVFITYNDGSDGNKAKYVVLNTDGTDSVSATNLPVGAAFPIYAANVETVDKIAVVYKDTASSIFWFDLLSGL